MCIRDRLVASYVRTVSQRPGINRFIRGQRVHARNCIEVMLTIKKEIALDSPCLLYTSRCV